MLGSKGRLLKNQGSKEWGKGTVIKNQQKKAHLKLPIAVGMSVHARGPKGAFPIAIRKVPAVDL